MLLETQTRGHESISIKLLLKFMGFEIHGFWYLSRPFVICPGNDFTSVCDKDLLEGDSISQRVL